MQKFWKVALLLLASGTASTVGAADRTWIRLGTTIHWSEGANWQGGIAPVQGDRLFFTTPLISSSSSTNDLGGLSFDSIVISGHNAISFDGAPITLIGDATISIGDDSSGGFNGGLRFTSSRATITLLDSGSIEPATLSVWSPMTIAGGQLTINGGHGIVNLNSDITEQSPTSITVNGGQVQVFGNNNLSGPIEINGGDDGSLVVGSNGALGTGSAGIVVNSGSLIIGGTGTFPTLTVSRPITLRGPPSFLGNGLYAATGPMGGGAVFLSSIDITGTQEIYVQGGAEFRGAITGSGGLRMFTDLATLSNPANSFGGALEIGGNVRAGASEVIPDSADVSIDHNAYLYIDGHTETVNSVHCPSAFGFLSITAGTGLLRIKQPSSLANCILVVTDQITLPPGGEMIVIRNDSGLAFSTAFNNLAEGQTYTDAHGALIYFTYRGGSGNDAAFVAHWPPASSSSTQPFTMTTSLQDMWWSGPSENGWGMSLIQHDDTLFGALYIYDAGGKPTWLVMPGGIWDPTHLIYSGSLYAPTGSPFHAYDTTHFAAGNAKGTIKVTFQDANDAIIDYTIGGVTGRKFVQREVFAAGSATAPDRSDLWWGGMSQNGWGITIIQQGSTLFPIWYTYDANGAPVWYVMPGGTWTSPTTYAGTLYRTTSSPWIGGIYDATKLQVINAGTFGITFNGDNASFAYTADGHSATVPLVKEPF
jgi:hypothetical protein